MTRPDIHAICHAAAGRRNRLCARQARIGAIAADLRNWSPVLTAVAVTAFYAAVCAALGIITYASWA